MGLFSCRSCVSLQKQNLALLAQLQDQQEAYIRLANRYEEERNDLLDRILAITQPGAYRELNRQPSYRPEPAERRVGGPVRISTMPGSDVPHRPDGIPNPGALLRKRQAPPEEGDRSSSSPEKVAAELVKESSG